jgi:hypothetical protein
MSAASACFGVLETKRGQSAVSVAMETCCGMRLDLVVALKKDQNRLGFEERVSLNQAKNFSRLSLLTSWIYGGDFCILLIVGWSLCDGFYVAEFPSF